MSYSLKTKGSNLEFISQINRDGLGTSDVSESHFNTFKDDWYQLLSLSMTYRTHIAYNGVNAYVVRIIDRKKIKRKRIDI